MWWNTVRMAALPGAHGRAAADHVAGLELLLDLILQPLVLAVKRSQALLRRLADAHRLGDHAPDQSEQLQVVLAALVPRGGQFDAGHAHDLVAGLERHAQVGQAQPHAGRERGGLRAAVGHRCGLRPSRQSR
jgi:hypothetical protein